MPDTSLTTLQLLQLPPFLYQSAFLFIKRQRLKVAEAVFAHSLQSALLL